MTIEYEHEGITYHEPLPRILLIDFPQYVVDSLKAKGHNVKSCFVHISGRTTIREQTSPAPPNEIDIIIIRDRATQVTREYPSFDAPVVRSTENIPFSSSIKWPNGYVDTTNSFCQKILEHSGTCVFFVSVPDGSFLQHAGFGVTPQTSSNLWPGRTAFRLSKDPSLEPLLSFINRWRNEPKVYVGLTVDPPKVINVASLVEDTASVPYAIVFQRDIGPRSGRVICLPDFGEQPDVLHSLLSEALPEFLPHLFPFRHDLSWLKEPEFAHPTVLSMEADKQSLHEETRRKLNAIDKEIQVAKQTEQYLIDLITSAGGPLKDAVKRTLEELFTAAGVTGISVLDVDSDPALRAGSTAKREDLRIQWGERVFLFNIAGRERYFKQTSLNQLSEHSRLYSRSNPMPDDKLRSILIANFNYGGGIDPRKRGKMFGSGTTEAQERLTAEGHRAIGTFDLYRLLRALQKKEVRLQPDDLLRLLTDVGILDWEDFKKNLQTPEAGPVKPSS